MSEKLNKEYFKTKKAYKNSLGKKKIGSKRRIFNIVISILLILGYSILNKKCQQKIEMNKILDSVLKNDNE